ncbi:hypothetical protein [Streptomyces lydicus]|uniref:hypothetical protein n=1 Tax=Streptomyces lydicus TaxID=47763 RepID=UPI0037D8B7DF
MNAWVEAPGEAPPEGGAIPPPLEGRRRVAPRLLREPSPLPMPGRPPGPGTAKPVFAHSRHVPAPNRRSRRRECADLPKTVSGRIRRIDPRERTARGVGGAQYWEENHR